MTNLLQEAFARAATLSPEEQDHFAHWILAELANVQRWHRSAEATADALEWLQDEMPEE